MLLDLLARGWLEVRVLSREKEKQDMLRNTLRNPNVR
jgi:UDP-N-acetylglucosamine 4,6-dehydratase/5-epimerase